MNQQQTLIPMTTGELLKQHRMERKLSLASVSQALKLDENILADLEQEKAGHMALVYRNGYIRSYARYLHIPEEEIKGLLVAPESSEPPIRNIFSEPPKRNPMERWLRATSYVLASLLIGTLAWQFTHEAVRLSQSGSRLQSAADTMAVPKNQPSQPGAQQFRGTVNASIATLGALHEKSTGSLNTGTQAWAAVSRPVIVDGQSRLELSVSADSWVEITDADEKELEMDLLRAGSDKSYHGKPPFRLLIGRASAVRLSIDGEPVDLAAFTREDVAQLNWPIKTETDGSGPDSD